MNNQVKASEGIRVAGKRKHWRASTRESATLVLDGIGEIAGFADDIGFGGVFFTSDTDLKNIPTGSTGTILFTMFNTLVDMNCRVASCREGGLGIEIQRHYSTEDLKEKVRGISTETKPKKIECTDEDVNRLLQRVSSYLHRLSNSDEHTFSKSEASLLAEETDEMLLARTTPAVSLP
ncbi:MAG: PilZ domain-containing protein [Magnetococcales bacterium]|nr:PilZ domain-containing protein [Magnetococcales bacterium]